MSEIPAQFRDLLGADEALLTTAAATVSDHAGDERVTVGLTDRRLLTVSDDSSFLNVSYEAIHSIRSRRRQSVDYEGIDYRVLALFGCLTAVAALVGSLAIAANSGPGIVAFLTIGGLMPLLYAHRDAIDGAVGGESAHDWLATTVDDERLERYERRLGRHVETDRAMLVAVVLVTLLALVGLLVVTSSLVVALLGLVAVGGVALVDYAVRHRDVFDGFHVDRRELREVVVHTADGRSIRLRLDEDSSLDRDLSRLTNGPVPTADVAVEPP